MMLRSDPKYPIHRTYVVKLSSDATRGALCGRLENLVSGKHRDFRSAHELLQLMECDIESGDQKSPDES
jgi:hypothetical protein